jgi:hypothetical protein
MSWKPMDPGEAVMKPLCVTVSLPAAFAAVKVTAYVPAVVYTWLGCRDVDVLPSPKSQAHDVGGPVDVSVNWTASGAGPDVGEAVNEATGATGGDDTTVR